MCFMMLFQSCANYRHVISAFNDIEIEIRENMDSFSEVMFGDEETSSIRIEVLEARDVL